MKAVLILIVSFLAEGALAAPLTITEHWSRCAANEIAPRPGTPLDVVGQLMLVCDEFPRRLTLVDREHPKTICVLDYGLSIRYQVGDLIHVQGVYTNDTSGFKRQIPNEHFACLTNLQVLGHEALPSTCAATATEVNTFKTGSSFIHVDGVISSVVRDASNAEWNWLQLRTETGQVRVAATDKDYPLASLHTLLDAKVQVRGIVHTSDADQRFRGNHVILYGRGGLSVLCPAPAPFDAPHLCDTNRVHRQQTSGLVVGTSRDRLFIRDAGNRFLPVVPADDDIRPSVGTRVSVSGFVDSNLMGLQISGAVFRQEDQKSAARVVPEPIDPERLFTTSYGDAIIDKSRYGQLVQIRGRIANSSDSIRTDGKILLECGNRSLTADVAHLLMSLDLRIGTNCLVDLSGLCLFDFDTDPADPSFPQFKGFVLVPRTSDDIVIVRQAPWWTPARLMYVIAVLVLIILGFALWNRMLHVLSEKRGRELADEQIASATADLKVEERTRLAVELHDSLSQTLTGVALQIDAAQRTGKSDQSKAEKFLENARAMLASCRQELRCCIWDLKSRTFDEKDMTEAVQKTLAPHLDGTKTFVRFNVPRPMLSESAAHDVLRIIRELVINAIRHGQARSVRIAGECKDGTIRFSVRDDGQGFDPKTVLGPAQGHFGLQGVRERIKDRNGTMTVDSAPGRGTKVTVTLETDEND